MSNEFLLGGILILVSGWKGTTKKDRGGIRMKGTRNLSLAKAGEWENSGWGLRKALKAGLENIKPLWCILRWE